MYYIEKLKQQIEKSIAGIEEAFKKIDSAEYTEQLQAEYPTVKVHPVTVHASRVGTLRGAIGILAVGELKHAKWLVESSEPDITWGERCAAVCEALGIHGDNIAEIESAINDSESELRSVSRILREIVEAVRESAREQERDGAVDALQAAGFNAVEYGDFEGWERTTPGTGAGSERSGKVERIAIEWRRSREYAGYQYTLEVDGTLAYMGKSGEFAALLTAVGVESNARA